MQLQFPRWRLQGCSTNGLRILDISNRSFVAQGEPPRLDAIHNPRQHSLAADIGRLHFQTRNSRVRIEGLPSSRESSLWFGQSAVDCCLPRIPWYTSKADLSKLEIVVATHLVNRLGSVSRYPHTCCVHPLPPSIEPSTSPIVVWQDLRRLIFSCLRSFSQRSS